MFAERLMNLTDVGTNSLVERRMENPAVLEFVGESPDKPDTLHLDLDRTGPQFRGRDLDDASGLHIEERHHLNRTAATGQLLEPGEESHATSCSALSSLAQFNRLLC